MKTKSCEDSMYQDGKYLSQTNWPAYLSDHTTTEEEVPSFLEGSVIWLNLEVDW